MTQFSTAQPLIELVKKQKQGIASGIFSVCSAHCSVLRSAMKEVKNQGEFLLIEATCNQVNQFGGYTGMTPADFSRYIETIAEETGFPLEKIILGGDHLGINPWQNEPIEAALEKACVMIADFVKAGFTKIHIDMSMPAADDHDLPLSAAQIAERSAILCRAAEDAASASGAAKPVYVIGSEVPPPGGAKDGEDELAVTSVADAKETIRIFREVYAQNGLQDAFNRTIALVVQPGVEFGDHEIHDYDSEKAAALSKTVETLDGMVFEAHSTDYQTADALRKLVDDHFAILKVGPELTFAYREAVYALAEIEEVWVGNRLGLETSEFSNVVERVMTEKPGYWKKFYGADPLQQAFSRKFSLSDRIRYYWNDSEIAAVVEKLNQNLSAHPAPYALISQYLPCEAQLLRQGKLANDPEALAEAHIGLVVQRYIDSCSG